MKSIHVKHCFRHDCQLPPDPRAWERFASPYATYVEKMALWMRNQLTIHRGANSRRYFRSYASYIKERRRYFSNPSFRFIIHPFSRFERARNAVMTVVWMFAIYFTCFVDGFMDSSLYFKEEVEVPAVLLVTHCVLLLDISLRFITGYQEEKTRSVVLERRSIAWHYLRTFFVFDMVPCLSHVVFVAAPDWDYAVFVCQFHVLRLARFITIMDNIGSALSARKVPETVKVPILLCVSGLSLVHILNCISARLAVYERFYGVPREYSWFHQYKVQAAKVRLVPVSRLKMADFDPGQMYLLYLTKITALFFGAGTATYKSHDDLERFLFALVLITGYSFYVYCLAKVLHLFGVINMSEMQFEALLMEAENYMLQNRFPPELQRRIYKYYDYKFNKKFFSENHVLSTLSKHMKMEVLFYSCQNLLDRVHAFRGLSRSAVGCILALLKQEIFVPGDTILNSTQETGSVYFILFGTCGIITMAGREVVHIEDGDFFGTIFDPEHYQSKAFIYSILALEMVEVYKLEPNDLAYCCKTHPEIHYKLEAMEKTKYRRFGEVFYREDDDDRTGDIVRELRQNRILEEGFKRITFAS